MDPNFRKIIFDLEKLKQHGYTEIILILLELSSHAKRQLVECINNVTKRTNMDGCMHDESMIFPNNPNHSKSGFGITILSGMWKDREKLLNRLEIYCRTKKYEQKAYAWIGMLKFVDVYGWTINVYIYLKQEEKYDEELETITKETLHRPEYMFKKVGRNNPCPCGSGKKYKKCHGKDI